MYPGVTVREALATELGISEACVQVRLLANICHFLKEGNVTGELILFVNMVQHYFYLVTK